MRAMSAAPFTVVAALLALPAGASAQEAPRTRTPIRFDFAGSRPAPPPREAAAAAVTRPPARFDFLGRRAATPRADVRPQPASAPPRRFDFSGSRERPAGGGA